MLRFDEFLSKLSKTPVQIFILVAGIVIVIYTLLWYNLKEFSAPYLFPSSKKTLIILAWNPGTEEWMEPSHIKCPKSSCNITYDKSTLNSSDAVIFLNFFRHDPSTYPLTRHKKIFHIYGSLEAPQVEYSPDIEKKYQNVTKNYIHLTLSYRQDSDIIMPYGKLAISKRKQTVDHYRINHAFNKRMLALALIRNMNLCPSGRMELISDLKQHIKVDNLGGTCQRSRLECYQELSKPYKFILAIENSFCKDYMTEKFFLALKSDVVPVVFGGADYQSVAPPHSFINVQDFKSIKDLASYLKLLDKNDTLYNEYFQWKAEYEVTDGFDWCILCDALQTTKPSKLNQPIADIYSWWFKKYKCYTYGQLPRKDNMMKSYDYIDP